MYNKQNYLSHNDPLNPAYLEIFLHAFTSGWGKTTHPLKDESFDAFAMDNNIKKYCRCKQ